MAAMSCTLLPGNLHALRTRNSKAASLKYFEGVRPAGQCAWGLGLLPGNAFFLLAVPGLAGAASPLLTISAEPGLWPVSKLLAAASGAPSGLAEPSSSSKRLFSMGPLCIPEKQNYHGRHCRM